MSRFWILVRKELRSLAAAPSFWIMLLVETPLVGYGFIQAAYLYAQASRSAVKFPELAKGMEPMQGIFVPTFGSLYLVLTLLFPFIAIRLIRAERDSGALKLLLQSPANGAVILSAKIAALTCAWLCSLVPIFAAIALWTLLGGHLFSPHLLVLLLGYGLYALMIIGVAFAASLITDSPTSAAIITLAATLGMWVLDFSSGTTDMLRNFAEFSPTELIRQFETGILSIANVLRLSALAFWLLAISLVFLHPGTPVRRKIATCIATLVFTAAVFACASLFPGYVDASEDLHNSFNPAYERALNRLDQPLVITVNLSPDDSRLREIQYNVLAKLERTVRDLQIIYPNVDKQALFTSHEDDRYGLITYEYAGRKDEGRSNSPTEILPIIFKLSGQNVAPDPVPSYAGFPLVLQRTNGELLFYCFLPIAILGCWWLLRLPPKIRS
jgi:ABC-2 type transport system permease protein